MTEPKAPRENGGKVWCFDKRIVISDVIKIGILLFGIIAAYFAMDSRLALVESAVADQKNFVTLREHELSLKNIETQVCEINRRLAGIEKKMDSRLRRNDS